MQIDSGRLVHVETMLSSVSVRVFPQFPTLSSTLSSFLARPRDIVTLPKHRSISSLIARVRFPAQRRPKYRTFKQSVACCISAPHDSRGVITRKQCCRQNVVYSSPTSSLSSSCPLATTVGLLSRAHSTPLLRLFITRRAAAEQLLPSRRQTLPYVHAATHILSLYAGTSCQLMHLRLGIAAFLSFTFHLSPFLRGGLFLVQR